MQVIKVLIPQINLFPLYYLSKVNKEIGDLVIVPYRNKELTGIVSKINCDFPAQKLKLIINDSPYSARISGPMMNLIQRASDYYVTELGSITKLVLPVDVNELPIKTYRQDINFSRELPKLSEQQNNCINEIHTSSIPILIKGITGSGKTEIYFHIIMDQLQEGKQSLVMLPEISLSEQIISRFTNRFGFEPIVWNSKVTKAKKKQILRGIIGGSVKIIIGARSTLFLPYKNLGVIVVDEEHDASYKQNDGVLYNARDMAVLRGAIEPCKVLLVSATPSIESIYNAKIGKYKLVELKSRFNKAVLPTIQLIDMRQESLAKNSWLSKRAIAEIKANYDKKLQTLIFLNRRGYAPLMLCKSCGNKIDCKACSASMVAHKELNRLECHHCGNTLPIYSKCPECRGEDSLILCGPGVERIEEEIKSIFPEYRTAIASKDQSSAVGEMERLLIQMEKGEIDILIGTQIITKGYHFPNLALVIAVDADIGFTGGDLRSSERTFQLLHQVGGRAGREDKKGLVLLQTYLPDNKVIKAIVENREEEYIEEELKSREIGEMPPYTKVAVITIAGRNPDSTKEAARKFVLCAPKSEAKILGPAEAIMYKLSDKYRYKILVIVPKNFNLQKFLKLWRESGVLPSRYQLKIDIDPQNLR